MQDDTEHGKVRAGGKLGWAGRLAPGSSSDDSGSSSGSDRSQEQASPAMSSGSGLAGARSSSGGRKKEREDDNLYEYKQGSRGSMSSELPDGGPEWLR